jgi:transcriptional regulator with XRE-family HTH domain
MAFQYTVVNRRLAISKHFIIFDTVNDKILAFSVPMKVFLGKNIKYLRTKKGLSQEELAIQLNMGRSRLNALENSQTKNPSMDDLFSLSGFFCVSIDTLLKINLTNLSEYQFKELEAGNDTYMTGNKIRILAVTADKEGKENVEFVPVKAKAGYVAGCHDPEFVSKLPKFQMPHLPQDRTFRMFPIVGDSMLPFKEGDYIITQYLENWHELKKRTLCVAVLKGQQDIVFKQITKAETQNDFILESFNPEYKSYVVSAGDVLELWRFHSYLSAQVPVLNSIDEIARKVNVIYEQIQKGCN